MHSRPRTRGWLRSCGTWWQEPSRPSGNERPSGPSGKDRPSSWRRLRRFCRTLGKSMVYLCRNSLHRRRF